MSYLSERCYYTSTSNSYLRVEYLYNILQKTIIFRDNCIKNGYSVDKLNEKILTIKKEISYL